ncbi:class I SAM-dependent methyltransferase [Ectothiorhodospira lacustris]|uniref:class I SAM-dependent methyltransferase n=1 Tax=Ectothiorhodospira lacustris TaxID=2899127 RepID=UPI001EE88A7E|nr:methyltransferase domain-containing protein [Ectothiorhodospira lacustris]MCG5499945.1 methyltransferase domain-containing protein [Ectothiorhodospira lacustris]MCG5508864.1 methyltransferase domain-containing protein [Ectothiorhodospira lacustris]MCG5520655.1 methyltransferase domain-containing protein [Ectothiorhodospira lacustris]
MRIPYTLWAPIYDRLIEKPSTGIRQHSLERLGDVEGRSILLVGVGTGLDFPFLPQGAHYTGVDLTPAMLKKATERAQSLNLGIELHEGNAMALPYEDAQFDVVVMHNILAVVPNAGKALTEATRVLKPGGRILILDKFLKPGESAPFRRLLGLVSQFLATRTDVVFENLMKKRTDLTLLEDSPAMLRGWFRHILLEKKA